MHASKPGPPTSAYGSRIPAFGATPHHICAGTRPRPHLRRDSPAVSLRRDSPAQSLRSWCVLAVPRVLSAVAEVYLPQQRARACRSYDAARFGEAKTDFPIEALEKVAERTKRNKHRMNQPNQRTGQINAPATHQPRKQAEPSPPCIFQRTRRCHGQPHGLCPL